MAGRTIHNFTFLTLSDAYWDLQVDSQAAFIPALARELQQAVPCTWFYQVAPLSADIDLLIWNSAPVDASLGEAQFFERLARIFLTRRAFLWPVMNYWGFSQPAGDSGRSSLPEIDPMTESRSKYLLIYPYIAEPAGNSSVGDLGRNRMGSSGQAGNPTGGLRRLQLLSPGGQEQDRVEVYETDDLYQFLNLSPTSSGEGMDASLAGGQVTTAIWQTVERMADLFRTHRDSEA